MSHLSENNPLYEALEQYPTPFYYYNGDQLAEHIQSFQQLLHPKVQLHYALKANNNITIANLLREWGCHIEIASLGELRLAEAAGYLPEEIIYTGPGKSEKELRTAMAHQIHCINVESLAELEMIHQIATEYECKVRVGIRVNPDGEGISGASIQMAGVARPFGIDESQLAGVFERVAEMPYIQVIGIQVYAGTQIMDEKVLLSNFRYTLSLAAQIQARYPVQLEIVNLGGGFGVPYFSHEHPLDIESVMQQLTELIDEYVVHLPHSTFIVESGRYLLAASGIYVCQALYTKVSKGEHFVIVDGGMHHHAGATFRGRRPRNNYPLEIIPRHHITDGEQTQITSIVGPLCTPDDCLFKNVELSVIHAGDYICILQSGAYGLTYSPTQFLGHATPAEVLSYKGKSYLIREQGDPEDLLLRQQHIVPTTEWTAVL